MDGDPLDFITPAAIEPEPIIDQELSPAKLAESELPSDPLTVATLPPVEAAVAVVDPTNGEPQGGTLPQPVDPNDALIAKYGELTPLELACREFDDIRRSLEEQLGDCTIDIERRKADLQSLKKDLKSVTEQLRRHMDRGPIVRIRPQPKLVEVKPEVAPVAKVEAKPGDVMQAIQAAAAAIAEQLAPEDWVKQGVDRLGLKEALTNTLKENGCNTCGELESLRTEIAQGHKKWPKGIGKGKVDLIEDAIEKLKLEFGAGFKQPA